MRSKNKIHMRMLLHDPINNGSFLRHTTTYAKNKLGTLLL